MLKGNHLGDIEYAKRKSICCKKQYPFLVLVSDRSCSTLSFGEKVFIMVVVHKTSQGKIEDENDCKQKILNSVKNKV